MREGEMNYGVSAKFTIDELHHPDWNCVNKTHNWCTYASEDLRVYWDTFEVWQKEIIIECLQSIADHEEWE